MVEYSCKFTKKAIKELKNQFGNKSETVKAKIELIVERYCMEHVSKSVRKIKTNPIGIYQFSLYSVIIDKKMRAIISIDKDDIFDKVTVIVISVVKHDGLKLVVNGIAESIFQAMINDEDLCDTVK